MHRYQSYFWLLLAGTTLFRLFYISSFNLIPQEAYYWLYAKHLDLSYFDHPPLAAWTIALSTYLGADSEFFVRLPAVLFAAGGTAVMYFLTREVLGCERLAFWAAALINLVVIFVIGGLIITPDVPLIFFWALVLFCMAKVMRTGKAVWWHAAGVFLGCALLGKYTAVLLLPCTFLLLCLSKNQRRWLLSVHPYLAILWALLLFSPVLVWNANHDWVSFGFQVTRRVGMLDSFQPSRFLILIGTQMLMLTPLLAIGLIYALYRLCRQWWRQRDDAVLFVLVYSLPVLLLCAGMSLQTLVKMNWPAPAYIAGILALVLVFAGKADNTDSKRRKYAARVGLGVAGGFALLLYVVPVTGVLPLGKGDIWSGWPQVARRVEQLKAELSGDPFVFSMGYKISSELVFYSTDKTMTLAQNVVGRRALQFDYWDSPQAFIGRNAILVYSDSMGIKSRKFDWIKQRFASVGAPESLPIIRGGRQVREFFLVACFDYKGPLVD